jgi:hypothetical protein
MYCPHCGAQNSDGNRYCVGCGSALSESSAAPAPQLSTRQRFTRLIGTSRQTRILTAATAAAIVVAIVAFLAISPSEEALPEDAYTRAADRACVTEKRTIAALEQQTVQQGTDLGTFAGALVTIVEEWRSRLREAPPPPTHTEAAQKLDASLLDVLIEAGTLARVTREDSRGQVAVQAQQVDAASARADAAIEGLGLSRCAEFGIGRVGE